MLNRNQVKDDFVPTVARLGAPSATLRTVLATADSLTLRAAFII